MLSVIVAGIETLLDDGVIANLVSYDGWGMAPQHRLASRGSLQHGDTDLGYRLDPRFGQLVLQLTCSTLSEMYARRDVLLDLFSPQSSPILKWTLPTGSVRQIECHYYQDMTLPWGADRWAAQRVALTLKCPDPTFYDPTPAAATLDPGGGGDLLVVPHVVPMLVGASTLDDTVMIVYNGNAPAYPHLIRISGPITDCILTNNSTGEKLDFSGITIAGGDYYDIDCRYGYKMVEDSAGVNKIADLTNDSDLATWHIAPHPEAGGGINSVRAVGSAITATTHIDLSFFERYLGV